ncbi:MAG: hypothetical protein PW734_02820 [Verrucomicrobium sp.]|nr:hypothetical protein [Verrucomicrobium sp.]
MGYGNSGSVFRSVLFQAIGFLLVLLAMLALITWITDGFSQTADAAAPPVGGALHQRYEEAVKLAEAGQREEALAIFRSILADEPKAKGSLYWSGFLNLELGRPEKALPYLARMRKLDPAAYQPVVLTIQANQALGRAESVEAARKDLLSLRNGGKTIHGLTDAKAYPRERFFQSRVEIDEFFEPAQDPYIVWEAVQRDAEGHPMRDVLLAYNPDTRTYLFGENVIEGGAIKQFSLYRRLTAPPAYVDFRTWAMDKILQ